MARFSVRRAWSELVRLTGRDLWERDLTEFGIVRRSVITALRIAAVVGRGFNRHQLTTRAGSLTYVTIFSLVPTLAVAFAMFSAFGGLADARDTLLTRIMSYLAVGVREEVTAGIDRILANINGGAIGATGLVFVIIAVFMLLSSIEDVFNDIWGVKRSRTTFQRLTLYWTVVTVSPTLVVLGMSLPALLRQAHALRWLLERTGTFDVFFGVAMPWLFVIVGFTLLYALMVSRKIPWSAAIIGGIAGGTLWFAAAHAYGWYARSTVYYANIYGSLAAIPIFIFWLYLSWLLVFIGAQVAFAWQNLDRYREEILATAPNQLSRERIALRLLAEAARRFVAGDPPLNAGEMATELRMSARAVNEASGDLVALGLLLEVGDEPRLLLTRDPRSLMPAEVLHRLRAAGEEIVARDDDPLMERVRALHERAEAAAEAAWDELSFVDMAREEGRAPAEAERRGPARRAAPASERHG
ncbi:MAG: YihY/virulence factor BrkB family protein [Candidatus Binatia bacterium]